MPIYNFNRTLISTNRSDIRKEVTNWFLQEIPGAGKNDNCSRNIYTVENYGSLSITLNRPAGLNKGFDFVVNIQGMFFKGKRRHSSPSHNDIVSCLKQVQQNNATHYNNNIKPIINSIFNCQNITFGTSIASFTDCYGNQQPIEIILLAIKWLFIEQDITYWNWSGRQMLYDVLKNNCLV